MKEVKGMGKKGNKKSKHNVEYIALATVIINLLIAIIELISKIID